MSHLAIVFLRRLALPAILFAGFNVLCVLVYRRLEGVRWQDALFWITHPHSIEFRHVHDATKFFAIAVYFCVFAFQIWIAERILVTIFRRQGKEAWKTMINDINVEKARDHFIVCGYGQVGRTVVDQLQRLEIPIVLIETNESLYRQLQADGIPVIQGDAKRHDVLSAAGIERARGICIVIDNDADNLYITVTARSLNSRLKIITRAGQQRYAQAMHTSGADEVVIPEYEGGVMTGRMIERFYPVPTKLQ
ncbi:MAG TPA: NAD(P)-binding protein [Terriglobales bacterium]|nr:NAD(P)-binding protein [Terriglobales bacterium]